MDNKKIIKKLTRWIEYGNVNTSGEILRFLEDDLDPSEVVGLADKIIQECQMDIDNSKYHQYDNNAALQPHIDTIESMNNICTRLATVVANKKEYDTLGCPRYCYPRW